jgi:hypothetical protein
MNIPPKLLAAIESAALDLAIELENNSPVGATGDFKRSWDVEVDPMESSVRVTIKNTDPVGQFKAIGRDAGGMPPIEPIRAWVAAKGLPANAVYLVRRKIAREGTERYRSGENVIGANRDNTIPPEKIAEYRDRLINEINNKLS